MKRKFNRSAMDPTRRFDILAAGIERALTIRGADVVVISYGEGLFVIAKDYQRKPLLKVLDGYNIKCPIIVRFVW